MSASAAVPSSSSAVQRNLIASTASIAALEDPSISRLLAGDDSAGGAHLFRVLPQWQRVEICIVELMQHSMEMQLQQATRTRSQREAKRREAEAAAAEIRPIVTAPNKVEKYMPAAAATSSSAKTIKRPPSSNAATGGAAASLAASSSSASAIATPVAPADSSSPPASDSSSAAEADSPFLAHFHLLSHLLLELNVPTLERLISFLDPSPAPATAAANANTAAATTTAAASTTGSTSSGGGPASGMALCFRLLDPSTQVALVELLLKAVLQWKEMLDTAERRQHDEIEAAQRRRARSQQQEEDEERKHDEHAEGEIAPGEGKPAPASASSSSRPAAATAPGAAPSPSRTPAVLAQQRLLHLLRWYSGLYRLSHILPRCLDYQNWLAAAVAIESRPAASVFAAMPMQGSLPPPAPRLAPVLLAAGALEDVNHTHLVDALECRLKHMEMRAESWRRWKRAKRAYGASAAADAMDRPSCPSSLHDVPLLVDGLLPPLPADVWLSFDGYAIDTGKMLLQLVITHLVHIEAVSEQARLTALLMRAWREWDLPSLLLESIFLSNLLALAGGLCMLAFQKHRPSSLQQQSQQSQPHQSILPSHHFSTDGSVVPASAARGDAAASFSSSAAPTSGGGAAASAGASAAPIFSAKLYLALTHYRLNAVYRANQSSNAHGVGSSSVSNSGMGGGGSILSAPLSSSSASSAPPSLAQSHRLWSEILANLHRDLDGGSSGSAQSSSSSTSTYMIVRGPSMPPPIIVNSAASTSSSASERWSLSADFAPSFDSSNGSGLLLVAFSCGHVFPCSTFASVTLPQFAHALQSLNPPIPITGKFIMTEYHRLIAHNNSGGGMGAISNGASNPNAASSGSSCSASSADTPGKCLAALSCPSCVFGALVSMHRKSESIRGATSAALVARQTSQALQASLASRAHLAHLEALGGGAESMDGGSAVAASASPAPALTKSSSSVGHSQVSHAPPSRSLTPNPNPTAPSPRSSDGTAGIRLGPGHRTTLSMMAASSSAAPPVSPSSSSNAPPHPAPAPAGRHKFGLSMSGMIPKVMTFGRVSLADLESS